MKEIRMAAVSSALVCSILGSFGCSQITPQDKPRGAQTEQRPSPVAPKGTYYTHTIKWPGENLSRISRWYTGSDKNWLRILEANPSIDPKRIKIGDSILIPEDLMTTHEPLPKSYLAPVAPVNKKKAPVAAAPEKTVPPTGEFELFGPIDTAPPPVKQKATDSPPPLETID